MLKKESQNWFENSKIIINKYYILHLKRADDSCIMLRDIKLYMTIPHSILNLGLKSALLAWRRAFKSALLACCRALKVPFSWELYHALFGGWGKHYIMPYLLFLKKQQNLKLSSAAKYGASWVNEKLKHLLMPMLPH